jgi:hypothetical protein
VVILLASCDISPPAADIYGQVISSQDIYNAANSCGLLNRKESDYLQATGDSQGISEFNGFFGIECVTGAASITGASKESLDMSLVTTVLLQYINTYSLNHYLAGLGKAPNNAELEQLKPQVIRDVNSLSPNLFNKLGRAYQNMLVLWYADDTNLIRFLSGQLSELNDKQVFYYFHNMFYKTCFRLFYTPDYASAENAEVAFQSTNNFLAVAKKYAMAGTGQSVYNLGCANVTDANLGTLVAQSFATKVGGLLLPLETTAAVGVPSFAVIQVYKRMSVKYSGAVEAEINKILNPISASPILGALANQAVIESALHSNAYINPLYGSLKSIENYPQICSPVLPQTKFLLNPTLLRNQNTVNSLGALFSC